MKTAGGEAPHVAPMLGADIAAALAQAFVAAVIGHRREIEAARRDREPDQQNGGLTWARQ